MAEAKDIESNLPKENPGPILTFKDLSYRVSEPVEKQILSRCLGNTRPSQLLAVLGPSGAGKSTFLDIISKQEKSGIVEGELLSDGLELPENYARVHVGYVSQDDSEFLPARLTVREHLLFHSRLCPRKPGEKSPKTKDLYRRVEDVIAQMGLEKVADSYIGSPDFRGISGGERRRVAIAVHLLRNPRALVLDEPTSGLDSYSAESVVRVLHDLSQSGKTVVFSIHQPPSQIFSLLDVILLLSRHGHCLFFGPPAQAQAFMETQGYKPLPGYNTTDFLLHMVYNIEESEEKRLADAFWSSKMAQNLIAEIDDINSLAKSDGSDSISVELPKPPSWFLQVYQVSKISLLNLIRSPALFALHVFATFMCVALILLAWFNAGEKRDVGGVHNRLGVLFLMTMYLCFAAMSSIGIMLTDRTRFKRDRSSGIYSSSAFLIGSVVWDLVILRAIPATLLALIIYHPVGLYPETVKYLNCIVFNIATSTNFAALCVLIGSIAPSIEIGTFLGAMSVGISLTFSGLLLSLKTIPSYLKWVLYIFPLKWTFENLVINEIDGQKFETEVDNPMPFGGEKLKVPLESHTILEEFGFSPSAFNSNVVVMIVQPLVYLFLTYIIIRFVLKDKR